MQLDLVYVTYNSQKWISGCFLSLLNQDYGLDQISVYVVDNGSSDGTIEYLEKMRNRLGSKLNTFEIFEAKENWGFGKANNYGSRMGDSDIVCFFNVDTELESDTLSKLSDCIKDSEEQIAMWELRQFPYEHPKNYNPITMETSWCSGAAFAIRRSVFEMLGGFDPHIFMYVEDVDLSWRVRSQGYRICYVPQSVIIHHSYAEKNTIKPLQYKNEMVNNQLLRYRFGSTLDILEGYARLLVQFYRKEVYPGSKRDLFQSFITHFRNVPYFLSGRKKYRNTKCFKPTFVKYDFSIARDGAFYENSHPKKFPLVSVLVRTCNRPKVLRETLCSLRNQTYPNIEIVVVEDGLPVAKQMIEDDFSDLRIVYEATGEKSGRSAAGNRAMTLAKGQYFNFLDDDDLFFADHIETLVCGLENSSCRAAYAFGFETPITVQSRDPYLYRVHDWKKVYRQPFDKIELCYHNYIPIQCIMFEKSLFLEYGGLDETLDALEDWDLWVRYSTHTDFICIEKTTSIYRVPFDQEADEKRQKALDNSLIRVREKHKAYSEFVSVYKLACLYEAKVEKHGNKDRLY